MDSAIADPVTRSLLPIVHLPVFLVGTLVWLVVLGLFAAGLLIARGFDPSAAQDALDPMTLGVLTIVQIVGMAVWAGLLTLAVSADGAERAPLVPADNATALARLRAGLALWAPPWGMVAVALVGGLCVWTLPTFIAEQLQAMWPSHLSTLDLVTSGLRDGELSGRLVMALAVAVSAPIFEEVVFRGYVYRVIEVAAGPLLALIGSTLLFAAYHLDPVHVVALLPTATFLGFLRWRSGSLLAPILAHGMNNGLGVVAAWSFPDDPTETLSVWFALSGFVITLAVAGAGHLLSRPAASPRA